jgi:hypothetical protein
MIDATNQTASQAGVDSTSLLTPPDPPNAINVKFSSTHVHVTVEDNSIRARTHNYFVEWDTEPSFGNAHPVDLHTGRDAMLSLPPLKDDGATPNTYYFRAFSGIKGASGPSEKIYFGSPTNPTPVQLVGAPTGLTPLASTGSGTASTTGQQGGTGFGPSQFSELQPNRPKAP